MPEIEITPPATALLRRAKRLSHKGVTFTEIDVSGDRVARSKMVVRANGRMTVRRFSSGPPVGGYDDLYALDRAGKLDPLLGTSEPESADQEPRHEHQPIVIDFHRRARADALSSTRSQPRRRGEADRRGQAGGADYVLTPEMTNILEVKRERLFAAIVAGRATRASRPSGGRAQARHISACRLARHQALARQGRQPLVPDRPGGRDRRPLRPDPHVRRRSPTARAIAIAQLSAGRDRRGHRPAVGPAGLTVCYDLRFPALYRALAEAGSSYLAIPSAFTRQTGEAHGTCSIARAIESGAFVLAAAQGGKHENGRDFRPFAGRRSMGPYPGGRRHRARCRARDHRPGRGGVRARENSLAAAWAAVRDHRADGGAGPSPRGARPGMIRYALACDNGHTFESWFQNSAAYDKQVKRGLIGCPACGSTKVEKALMTPGLSGTRKRGTRAAAQGTLKGRRTRAPLDARVISGGARQPRPSP